MKNGTVAAIIGAIISMGVIGYFAYKYIVPTPSPTPTPTPTASVVTIKATAQTTVPIVNQPDVFTAIVQSQTGNNPITPLSGITVTFKDVTSKTSTTAITNSNGEAQASLTFPAAGKYIIEISAKGVSKTVDIDAVSSANSCPAYLNGQCGTYSIQVYPLNTGLSEDLKLDISTFFQKLTTSYPHEPVGIDYLPNTPITVTISLNGKVLDTINAVTNSKGFAYPTYPMTEAGKYEITVTSSEYPGTVGYASYTPTPFELAQKFDISVLPNSKSNSNTIQITAETGSGLPVSRLQVATSMDNFATLKQANEQYQFYATTNSKGIAQITIPYYGQPNNVKIYKLIYTGTSIYQAPQIGSVTLYNPNPSVSVSVSNTPFNSLRYAYAQASASNNEYCQSQFDSTANYTVNVKYENKPVSGIAVSFDAVPNNVSYKANTDGNGNARFSVNYPYTGTYQVTISGSIPVGNSSIPFKKQFSVQTNLNGSVCMGPTV